MFQDSIYHNPGVPEPSDFNRVDVGDEISTADVITSDVGNPNGHETGFYAFLTTLRLVCRAFNKIVTPALYREVNLLVVTAPFLEAEKTLIRLFLPHIQHIRSLYMWGGSPNLHDPDLLEDYCAKFLREGTNLTSLGIYSMHVTLGMSGQSSQIQYCS
ncbi:hypothetical protein CPB86DRAFT_490912 [Serendipita vermifera]|nr:hypothetical protein CPB86DRAFT_490912 [Serendipita vermifera]